MESFAPVIPLAFMFLVPVVAIVGGITAGIVKSHQRARMVEFAQKERIAAIEHGLDVSQLPPLPAIAELMGEQPNLDREHRQDRRARNMMVWGIVLGSFGLSLAVLLFLVTPPEVGAWGAGVIFLMVGAALAFGARFVRPDAEDLRAEKEIWRGAQATGCATGREDAGGSGRFTGPPSGR